ncbi:MAG: hypothetical protein FWG80_00475 [Alphaproteobacteria bacterium]|nr:hypothetical protein [Alphaproteobacteria bacterium]
MTTIQSANIKTGQIYKRFDGVDCEIINVQNVNGLDIIVYKRLDTGETFHMAACNFIKKQQVKVEHINSIHDLFVDIFTLSEDV